MIKALNTHRINTLIELRRIERIFAVIGTAQVAVPMTNACMPVTLLGSTFEVNADHEIIGAHYVNSHGLLTELRSLTRNYPFSSDCLDEAKRRVYSDPTSNRSWNTCWLALTKIQLEYAFPYPRTSPAVTSRWRAYLTPLANFTAPRATERNQDYRINH